MRELLLLGAAAWLAGAVAMIVAALAVRTVQGVLLWPFRAWARARGLTR